MCFHVQSLAGAILLVWVVLCADMSAVQLHMCTMKLVAVLQTGPAKPLRVPPYAAR
jgi:hypothetical protein